MHKTWKKGFKLIKLIKSKFEKKNVMIFHMYIFNKY
jgi:hypothetical protein